MRTRPLNGYFIRVKDDRVLIVARYDNGTEEVHAECKSTTDAELQLTLATGGFRYEERQFSLDLSLP